MSRNPVNFFVAIPPVYERGIQDSRQCGRPWNWRSRPKSWDSSGEFLSLAAGTDIAPLLEGLPGDACQAPHWGYMIEGGVVVTYEDGTTDTCRASDVFYWPPGHSVRVTDDAEVIMFSPQLEHTTVLDHMLAKMTAV